MIGIGGGLISIPLVFICYEIWQQKSHRKLNQSVYQFAENQMKVSVSAVKSKLELLIEGAFVYFENGTFLIDDEDIENIKIKQHSWEDDSDDPETNILDFDRVNVFEVLVNARYLSFQLSEFSLTEELSRLEGLLSNSFIMQRLDDSQIRAIIYLIEVVSMLESFLMLHDYVFVKTSINIHGFSIEQMNAQHSTLKFKFTEDSESDVLDIIPTHSANVGNEPLPAYVVNPDYYNVLSDLIYDVIDGINQWKAVSDPVYVDYENGQISIL